MIMHSLLMTLEKRKSILLQNYPSNEELTKDFFDRISDMLLTDFDSISRNLSRTKIVFNCISTIIETAFSSNIQKQYLLDILNIFDDSDVARYLKKKLGDRSEMFFNRLAAAKAQIIHSQWSDPSSNHQQRILDFFQNIK